MNIIIGSDHAGYELKEKIKEYLINEGISVDDNGNAFDKNDDYPDIAYEVGEKIRNGKYDRGILVCGSGIGISIAANKVNGIRCGACNDEYLVEMGRKDNDINVLAMGSRVIDFEKAKKIVDIFLNTEFLGDRHKRRVDKISEIEKRMKEVI